MPLATYGSTNPAGVDPWPIETNLAQLATGGSTAEAQNMLENYQQERLAQTNAYNQDLVGQHAFAYQQLAQQMQENYLKAIPEFAKSGTLDILANAPQYAGAFGGASPDVIQDAIRRATMGQTAETFQKSGTGFNQFAQGGLQVDPNAVPGMAGVKGTLTDPALVRAAQIRANAQIAAAGIGAGGGRMTVSSDIPSELGGFVHVSQGKVAPGDVSNVIDAQTRLAQARDDARRGVTSGGGGSTNLVTNSPVGKQAQNAAMQFVEGAKQAKGDPNAQAMVNDVRGAMKGAAYDVRQGNDGKLYLQGKTGKYALPGQ
jgi:hypothetical protein